MNIRIEENTSLTEREDVVFPLRVVHSLDSGEITVYVMEKFRDTAAIIENSEGDLIFSHEVRASILSELCRCGELSDYDGETVSCTEYAVEKRELINKSLILDSTEPLLPECEYENLTPCVPDPNGEGLLCFGTVVGGKIVSAALENPHHPDDTVIDIAVETAEEYENNGYGASNVAALAYYLLDPDVLVTYTAEDDNTASVRIAEKVGFSPCQRVMTAVFYKK